LARARKLPDRFPAGAAGTSCNKLQQIRQKARNAAAIAAVFAENRVSI